ncbi:MAG: hypothetical protein NT175_10155 [Bacteroidetes bacterium]|nr:hypothetical protein [Bacteroidota bacterium]
MLIIISGCNPRQPDEADIRYLDITGEFLGQGESSSEPRLFAADILSAGKQERDISFSYEGKELFYTISQDNHRAIMHTYEEDGKWIVPVIASFSGTYNDLQTCTGPYGKGLYFVSNRPLEKGAKDTSNYDIWYTYKTMEGWAEPMNLGPQVNTPEPELSPSVTKDGTLYFIRQTRNKSFNKIYRASFKEGKFSAPERLTDTFNGMGDALTACIAPDESLLVFISSKREGLGMMDYYISFRDEDGNWSIPANMGRKFNSEGDENSAHFSAGGKYIFFTSARADSVAGENMHIYWAETGILKRIK